MKHLCLLSLLMLCLTACTHNNGDIGLLFGRWTIAEAERDGQRLDVDGVIDFQSHTCRVTRVLGHGDTEYSIGSWSLADEDTRLTLDFGHDDDQHSGQYSLPAWMGLTEPVTAFDVTEYTSSAVTLVHEGQPSLRYRLTRQY